ncbi:MAG: phenylalanine--tRNA ligase subunit alpha [Desulfobacterales bacterium]|nr:phenylalanine--tRNA ligase subunit alpha [Desulfobacterales bacterium]
MDQELLRLQAEAEAELAALAVKKELDELRVKYLGRKGSITGLLRNLGTVAKQDRPRIGKLANQVKQELEAKFKARAAALTDSAALIGRPQPDRSLPGRQAPFGRPHPITRIMGEVCEIFEMMGFAVAEGPEVELDFYNFEALNIPKHHPARDMHDTFYVDQTLLLRTHTSPMQIRAMEQQKPPLRMIAPGKVYRCDSDITHTPMFHQVEGFLVDRQVSFADLKGVLSVFCRKMFGDGTALRFRPSFFPFTEPSAEMDIACVICGGSGCRVCKQTGWMEILGAGLIDPEVLKMVNYDPEEYSGFAFGLGIERIAMLKHGIDDIRLFYENDLRFLNQF